MSPDLAFAHVDEPPCSECGGRWTKTKPYRLWHKEKCSRLVFRRQRVTPAEREQREQQDAEAAVLRSAYAGVPVKDCGCRGDAHSSTTCTRFYEFYPDAEIGREHDYGSAFDG